MGKIKIYRREKHMLFDILHKMVADHHHPLQTKPHNDPLLNGAILPLEESKAKEVELKYQCPSQKI